MKKFMIFVSDEAGRMQVEAGVTRVLAHYPHSILAETDDHEAEQLKAKGLHLEELPGSDIIRLRSLQFDPKEAPLSIPAAMAAPPAAPGESNCWIVQFVGPSQSEWNDAITALGARIGEYIPDNAFLVFMTSDVKALVESLEFVRWVGIYEPAFKISPTLMGLRGNLTRSTLATAAVKPAGAGSVPGGNLKVVLQEASDESEVQAAIARMGGEVLSVSGTLLRVALDTDHVAALASEKGVRWIEPVVLRKLVNDVASALVSVQQVRDNHGLDGEGQVVAVADTGLDTGINDASMHNDFEGRITAIHSWPILADYHIWVNNASFDDGAADMESGHGTHVAGSVLGSGASSSGTIRGMAPAARLVFQAVEQYCDFKPAAGVSDGYYLVGIPDDLGDLFQQSYDDGARILTNSWGGAKDNFGNYIYGQYTTESSSIDQFMWNHRDALILFAAGNDGKDADNSGAIDGDSLLVQATAKNCLTVGATENDRPHGSTPPPGYDFSWSAFGYSTNPVRDDHVSDDPEGLAAFSSRGPTDDGRIKPDVVAPGTNILSVRSSVAVEDGWGLLPAGDARRAFYMYMGGTSMATPITAGTCALVRQYLERACLHANPSGALVKALIVHGAHPLAGQYTPAEVGAVPNNDEGWGRVDLQRTLFPELPAKLEFRDAAADAVGTGEVASYTFPVLDTSVPLRATLAWSDYPSSVAAGGALVNQLRLSVVAPGGGVTQGNPANNNVQQVVIAAPVAGTYTVRVSGINVPTGTMAGVSRKQEFALAVTAGLEFVDLYIRDNSGDHGVPPTTGCLYLSPDIWVSATDDPSAPPALNPEYGQTNYVFVRVHNRGSKAATDATVKLYWANPGTNLSRPHWRTDGISVGGAATNSLLVTVPARTAAGDSTVVCQAFEWQPPDPATNTHEPGHFCLFATIDHPEDHILQEDVDKVRWESNLAWKNEIVKDQLPNSTSSAEFYVAGIPGISVGELRVDATSAPAGAEIRLKIPSRYWDPSNALNLNQVWLSEGGQVCQIAMPSASSGRLSKIKLKSRENTLVRIEVQLPQSAKAGDYYPISVEQLVNGNLTGRVSLVARVVGTPAYIANSNPESLEVHVPNCYWAKKIAPHHRVPYDDLKLAMKRGYNGCHFCLPDFSTD